MLLVINDDVVDDNVVDDYTDRVVAVDDSIEYGVDVLVMVTVVVTAVSYSFSGDRLSWNFLTVCILHM